MADAVARDESSEQLEGWLLALLRYAITRCEPDRIAADAIARSLDARGSRFDVPDFAFFGRMTRQVCEAVTKNDTTARDDLERFLKRVESPRLRRAFEAALELSGAPAPAKTRAWLWKGLEKRESAVTQSE